MKTLLSKNMQNTTSFSLEVGRSLSSRRRRRLPRSKGNVAVAVAPPLMKGRARIRKEIRDNSSSGSSIGKNYNNSSNSTGSSASSRCGLVPVLSLVIITDLAAVLVAELAVAPAAVVVVLVLTFFVVLLVLIIFVVLLLAVVLNYPWSLTNSRVNS